MAIASPDKRLVRQSEVDTFTRDALANPDSLARGSLNETVNLATSVYTAQSRRLRKPRRKRHLTKFDAGHGWVMMNTPERFGPGTNLNDKTMFVSGSQSIRVDTVGTQLAYIEKTGENINLANGTLRLRFRLGDLPDAYKNIGLLAFYAGDAGLANHYMWKLIDNTLAHQAVGFHYTAGAEWVEITLPIAGATVVGAPNRSAITHLRIQQKNNSETAVVPVWWDEMDLVEDETSYHFPNGVVSFTFDDNHISHYSRAFPILTAAGLRGTFFSIINTIGTLNCATLDNLIEMHNAGNEISAHSFTIEDHHVDFQSLPVPALRQNLDQMQHWLAQYQFKGKDIIAYPKGAYDRDALEVVSEFYTSGRTTTRDTNYETLPPADPYRVRTIQVFNTHTVDQIKAAIDKAYAEKAWLVLTYHMITAGAPQSEIQWSEADFQQIVDYIGTKGIDCLPYGEVLAHV